jgi:hypothetical protein
VEVQGVDSYLRHIKKFGPEGVLEAARDAGLPISELVMIQTSIDAREDAQAGRFGKKKRRLSAEQRVKRFLGIADEEGDQ